ncbi:hypothetical protein BaRGS_00014356 [Batillaria attramentaria]|uniref:Uncharacterized protein n=1 Tax=Batillaria attramentaria TaxID=370345 RepID=A0ABD0L4Y9_9CAEN
MQVFTVVALFLDQLATISVHPFSISISPPHVCEILLAPAEVTEHLHRHICKDLDTSLEHTADWSSSNTKRAEIIIEYHRDPCTTESFSGLNFSRYVAARMHHACTRYE